MESLMMLYVFLLFFILTPGILLRLPPKGSKVTVALVHAGVFALVYHFTCDLVSQFLHKMQ
jgi:hypothetical protein